MNKREVPVIKEIRIKKLIESLFCIKKYETRMKQKECILSLYPDKHKNNENLKDKSIFRGMVLTSLKKLGFIYGKGDIIKLTSNGNLLCESYNHSSDLFERVLRLLVLEKDIEVFGFLSEIEKRGEIEYTTFLENMKNKIKSPSSKQLKERVDRWRSILIQTKLLQEKKGFFKIDLEKYNMACKDSKIDKISTELFKEILFRSYYRIGNKTAGIVDFADLRKEVASKLINEYNIILSERQFDEIFKKIPFENETYKISLGKPMRAREQLFEFKGKYYRTLHIKRK